MFPEVNPNNDTELFKFVHEVIKLGEKEKFQGQKYVNVEKDLKFKRIVN